MTCNCNKNYIFRFGRAELYALQLPKPTRKSFHIHNGKRREGSHYLVFTISSWNCFQITAVLVLLYQNVIQSIFVKINDFLSILIYSGFRNINNIAKGYVKIIRNKTAFFKSFWLRFLISSNSNTPSWRTVFQCA